MYLYNAILNTESVMCQYSPAPYICRVRRSFYQNLLSHKRPTVLALFPVYLQFNNGNDL